MRLPLAVSALAVALFAAPAPAVIKVLTPLGRVVKDMPSIFVAEVDKVEPDKPGVVFKFVEDLKGKAPAERFAVNLTGDTFAKKDDHTTVMLDRLAPGRKLVVFTLPKDGKHLTFGYLEGTWFQLQGTTDPDTKAIRWAFLHCEPYFRRTFKGTTAELRAVVADAVAGKKDPPEPDEKEPHGYGPVAEKKDEPKKERELPEQPAPLPAAAATTGLVPFAAIPFHLEPLFGVIPSSILLGPLAILAAVFPATFGGLMSGMARWRALLVVVSANSLLATLYFFPAKYKLLPDPVPWWCGEPLLMGVLLTNIAIGIVWAGRRYRVAAVEDPTVTAVPTQSDFHGLAGFAVVLGLMILGLGWWFGWAELLNNPGREFTAAFVGLAAAAAYSAYRMATHSLDEDSGEQPTARMSAPGEAVALSAMLLFGAVLLTTKLGAVAGGGTVTTEAGTAVPSVTAPKLQDFELWYETRELDKAMSAACVTEKFVYLGGYRQTAFSLDGVLACVNRATGKDEWVFDSSKIPAAWKTDNGNGLRTVYSTPAVANGKLYFGEGLHTDADCRLFCLDATTGQPLWKFETKSHTEGAPVVVGGQVYFSAGDDGLYCADAETGKEVWRYQSDKQPLHIDTPVTVANGRVYAGSGYQTFAAFALDASTGKESWKKELPLRSFGTPLVSGADVFYGLGTGNLTEDLSTEKEPGREKETAAAGMLVCFDAEKGTERWRVPLPASVHTTLAVDGRHLYAACRDGWMYARDRTDGKLLWRASSGLPIVSGPVVAADATGRFPLAVYLAGPSGQVTCHDPITGATYWGRSVPELVGRRTEVQSQPTLLWLGPDKREVFVPVTLTNKNNAETKAGIVRFTDSDELFPLLVKGLERYEKAGFVKP